MLLYVAAVPKEGLKSASRQNERPTYPNRISNIDIWPLLGSLNDPKVPKMSKCMTCVFLGFLDIAPGDIASIEVFQGT